jgi:hypothetical protein
MHSEILRAFDEADRLDVDAPLLAVPNQASWSGPSKLGLALGEVIELRDEFARDGTFQFSQKKAAGEGADVFVFLRAWLQAQKSNSLDLTLGASNINGAGGRSDTLEVLEVLLLESHDDPRAAREAIFLLISLHRHLGLSGTFLQLIIETVKKARANRPPPGYQDTEQGKPLTPPEQEQAFIFKEQAYRMIRKAVKKASGREVLRPSDWLPHWDIISSWRQGDAKLVELRARLARPLGEERQTAAGVHLPSPAQVEVFSQQLSGSLNRKM